MHGGSFFLDAAPPCTRCIGVSGLRPVDNAWPVSGIGSRGCVWQSRFRGSIVAHERLRTPTANTTPSSLIHLQNSTECSEHSPESVNGSRRSACHFGVRASALALDPSEKPLAGWSAGPGSAGSRWRRRLPRRISTSAPLVSLRTACETSTVKLRQESHGRLTQPLRIFGSTYLRYGPLKKPLLPP